METAGCRTRAAAAVASLLSACHGHHRRQERGSDWTRKTSITRIELFVTIRSASFTLFAGPADTFIKLLAIRRSRAAGKPLSMQRSTSSKSVTGSSRASTTLGYETVSAANCDHAPKNCLGLPSRQINPSRERADDGCNFYAQRVSRAICLRNREPPSRTSGRF